MLYIICLFVLNILLIYSLKIDFPKQFSSKIEIVNHLIHPSSQNPKSIFLYQIYYDFINKNTKIIMLNEKNEPVRTIIRKYNEKIEYSFRYQPYLDCKFSILGEQMEGPKLSNIIYDGDLELFNEKGGSNIYHSYLFEEYDTRVELIFDPINWMPKQLDVYRIEEVKKNYADQCLAEEDDNDDIKNDEQIEEENQLIPISSYIYYDYDINPIDSSIFDNEFEFKDLECLQHTGGFSYLHILHYFLKI